MAWLEQVALGVPGDRAARWAGVEFGRALRMACDPNFPIVITALRMGVDTDDLQLLADAGERVA